MTHGCFFWVKGGLESEREREGMKEREWRRARGRVGERYRNGERERGGAGVDLKWSIFQRGAF